MKDDHQEQEKQADYSFKTRYMEGNPTVNVRINRELQQELEEPKITSGLSMADILKAELDKLKPDAEEIDTRAYFEGYADAEERVQGNGEM